MYKLVLIRHGESTLEPLKTASPAGRTWTSAHRRGPSQAGQLLKEAGCDFDIAYTSVLKRAVWTLWYALEEMSRTWLPCATPGASATPLRRPAGGLNRADMAKRYGDEQVLIWRRSCDTRRPPSNHRPAASAATAIQRLQAPKSR